MLSHAKFFPAKQVKPVASVIPNPFGPNLTPFGRDFKLGGYTMGGGKGMNASCQHSALWSWEHLPIPKNQTVQSQDQPDGTLRSGYNKNNNFTFDRSVFVLCRSHLWQGWRVQSTNYNAMRINLKWIIPISVLLINWI